MSGSLCNWTGGSGVGCGAGLPVGLSVGLCVGGGCGRLFV